MPGQGPSNSTAFDATEHVSKTPNLTPVVKQEVMVDPPTSRELTYECISEKPVSRPMHARTHAASSLGSFLLEEIIRD